VTRLALIGMGRMGRAISALAPERDFDVVAMLGRNDLISRESLRGAEVAIEFTSAEAAPNNARACAECGCPVVVGTTGWSTRLDDVRASVVALNGALLTAPNFSVGVALFDRVVAEASRLFAGVSGFEACLVETHHSAKRDAPSGTALALAATAERASGHSLPITSVRVGSVPGTHEIVFDAQFEQVRLVHEARDRRVFAAGALVAARWLVGRRGVFTMQDVISAQSPTTEHPSA
jgi:4-hydroxy-tetrahydrodipicolinate reductase